MRTEGVYQFEFLILVLMEAHTPKSPLPSHGLRTEGTFSLRVKSPLS